MSKKKIESFEETKSASLILMIQDSYSGKYIYFLLHVVVSDYAPSKANNAPQLTSGSLPGVCEEQAPVHWSLCPHTATVMEYLHLALRPICSLPPLLTRSEVSGLL